MAEHWWPATSLDRLLSLMKSRTFWLVAEPWFRLDLVKVTLISLTLVPSGRTRVSSDRKEAPRHSSGSWWFRGFRPSSDYTHTKFNFWSKKPSAWLPPELCCCCRYIWWLLYWVTNRSKLLLGSFTRANADAQVKVSDIRCSTVVEFEPVVGSLWRMTRATPSTASFSHVQKIATRRFQRFVCGRNGDVGIYNGKIQTGSRVANI